MSGLEGQRLGNYEILAKLGQGGMGAVYKARDSRLQRLVAIKVLPAQLAMDEEFVRRFQREAIAAAQFCHSNLVQVFDIGESGDTHFIIMELVEGESLGRRLQRKGRMPAREAVAVTLYVAQALAYAWQKAKLIHRDIKPANIFLSQDGEVKLGDLGLAKSLQDAASNLTLSGAIMGTPHYMSPEQGRGDQPLDLRSDIYSLGCVLYHMLTGRPPYQGDSTASLIYKHVHEPPPPLREAAPDCPPALVTVAERMMAKKPADRPQTYEALLYQLAAVRRALTHAPAQAAPAPMRVPAVPAPAVPPAVRSAPVPDVAPPPAAPPFALILGGTVAASMLVLGLLLWAPWNKGGSGRPTSPPTQLAGVATTGRHTDGPSPGGSPAARPDAPAPLPSAPQPQDQHAARAPASRPSAAASHTATKVGSAPPPPKTNVPVRAGMPPPAWNFSAGAPPPAVAPFDAPTAGKHQAAWAQFLGVPVELTNAVGMRLVFIPPGEYLMGGDRKVRLTQVAAPFYIGKYEVTQAEWESVTGSNPSHFKNPRHPVETVSWDDCQSFLQKLSERCSVVRNGYCLPTMAQWEYACRAGTTNLWYCGDHEAELADYAWYGKNASRQTHPVGGKKPNAWGLHDMHGNVFEWCLERMRSRYSSNYVHVDRGGSWAQDAASCLSGSYFPSGKLHDGMGLRVAWNVVNWDQVNKGGQAETPPPGVSPPGKLLPGAPPPADDARWGPWEDLFDGKTLRGWTIPARAGSGESGDSMERSWVRVEAGQIRMDHPAGRNCVIQWSNEFPATDYEVACEVMRLAGQQDLCDLIFPVEGRHLELCVGGYGNKIVGLAMLDGKRADANATTRHLSFDNGRWYRLRLRVQPERVSAWIDDVQVMDLPTQGHRFTTRGSLDLVKPFGVLCNSESSALRNLRLRRLQAASKALSVALGGGVKLELVWIPPGGFLMGSPEGEANWLNTEGPQHRVTISKGFWMGKYEVTQAQWEQLMGYNPSKFRGANLPVEQVSWNDCQAYIKKLDQKLGTGNLKASLPTEAQWEYACRAGTTTSFHYGSRLDASLARFKGNPGSGKKTDEAAKEVGSFPPNAWGLYDMHGNVGEWCQDMLGPYGHEAVTDPVGPSSGSSRAARGGAWSSEAKFCRSAFRYYLPPGLQRWDSGLRVVLLTR